MISNQNKNKKDDVINSGAAPGAVEVQSGVIDTINKINFNSADELKAILNDSEGAIVKNKDLLAQLSKKKNAEAEKKFYEKVQTIKLDELGDDDCLKSILQSWGKYLSGKQLDYLVDCEGQKKLLQSLDGYKLIDLVRSDGFKQFCLFETATGEKKKAILSLINFDDWNRCNYIYYLLKDNMKSKVEKYKARIDKALKKFTLFVGEHIENLSDDQVSSLIPNCFNNEKIDEALDNHKEKNKDKNSGGKNKIDDKNQQVKIEDKNGSKQEDELQNAREKINKRIDKLKKNKLYQNLFELRNIKYDMADGIFDMLSKLQENERSELIGHLLLNPRLYWSHVRTILDCLETDEKDDENKKQVKQLIVDALLSKKDENKPDSDLIVNDSYILENANLKGVINLIDHCGDKLPQERVDGCIKKIELENCRFSNLEKLLPRHWDKISSDQYNALIGDFNRKYAAESQKQKKEDYSDSVNALERIIFVSNFLIDQISKLTSENKNDNKDKITMLRQIGDAFFSQLKNVNVDGLKVCWNQIQKNVSEKANVLREALRAQNKIKDNEDFKKTLVGDSKEGYEKYAAKYVEENKAKIEKLESQKDTVLKAIETHNDNVNKFIRHNLTEQGRKIFSSDNKKPEPYFTNEQIKVLALFARSFDKDTGGEVVPNFILPVLDVDLVKNPGFLFDSDCLFEPLPDGSKPILEKFVVGDKKWAENQSKITKVFKSLTAKSLESLDLKLGYENNKNYPSQKPTEDYSSFCKTGFCDLFYNKLQIIHEELNENGSIMLDGLNQLSVDSRVLFDFCLGSWIIKNRDFCKEHSEELEQIVKSRFDFGRSIEVFRDNEPNKRIIFTDKQKNAVVAYIFFKYRTKDSIDLQKNLAMLLEKTGNPQNVKFDLNDIGKVAKFIPKIGNDNINRDILQCLLNNMSDSAKKGKKWLFEAYAKYHDAYGLKITDKADDDIFPEGQKQAIIELIKSGLITVSDIYDDDDVYCPAVSRLIKDASDDERAEIFLKQVQILKQSNKNEAIELNNQDFKKLIELFGDSELKLTQNQLVELLCNVDVSWQFQKSTFAKCFPYYNNDKSCHGLRISCDCENTETNNEANRLTMVNYIRIVSNVSIKERYVNIVDFRSYSWADKKDIPNDEQYWERSDCYDYNNEGLNQCEGLRRECFGNFPWAVDNIQVDSLKKNTLLDCYNDLKLAGVINKSFSNSAYISLKSHLKEFKKNDIENLVTKENIQYLMKYLWNVSALCYLSFNGNRSTKSINKLKDEFWNSDLFGEFEKALDNKVQSQNGGFCIECVLIRKLIWELRDSKSKEGEALDYETFIAVFGACTDVIGEKGIGYLARDDEEKNPSEQQLKENIDLVMEYVNEHFAELFLDCNKSGFKEQNIKNWEVINQVLYYSCGVLSKYLCEYEDKTKYDFSGLRNQYLDSLCKKLNESLKALQNDKKLNIEENDFIQNLDRMVRYAETRYFKKDNEEIQDNKEFLALKEYANKLKQDLELKQKNDNQEENKKLQDSQEEINQNKNEKEKEKEKENKEFENNQQQIDSKEKEDQKKKEGTEMSKKDGENDSSDEKINEEKNQVDNGNKSSNESSNIENPEQNNNEQERIEEIEIEDKDKKEQNEQKPKEKMIAILNKFNDQNNKYALKKAIERWKPVNKQEKEQEKQNLKTDEELNRKETYQNKNDKNDVEGIEKKIDNQVNKNGNSEKVEYEIKSMLNSLEQLNNKQLGDIAKLPNNETQKIDQGSNPKKSKKSLVVGIALLVLGIILLALSAFLKFGIPVLGFDISTISLPIAAFFMVVGVGLCLNYCLSTPKPPKTIDTEKKPGIENSLQESIENLRNQSQSRNSELKKTTSNKVEEENKDIN